MIKESRLKQLQIQTQEIIGDLHDQRLASLVYYPDYQKQSTFSLLQSPKAFASKNLLLIVSGIPEEAGVWSYTLLSMGRVPDTSMRVYFEMAQKIAWGVIALNPHENGKEGGKDDYFCQLAFIFNTINQNEIPKKNIVVLCFSAGGSIFFEYLHQNKGLIPLLNKIILLDTTPPPLTKTNIQRYFQESIEKTVLYGLINEKNKASAYAQLSASILGIEPFPVRAKFHGELPNLLSSEVEKHLIKLS